jgi:histidinol-phosphatase (PHP family)
MVIARPAPIDTSVDSHMHTSLCHHARGTMEEYVQAGIRRGLKRIIFLEHLEVGIDYFETTWLTDRDFELYFQEGKRLQNKYQGGIEIGLGVEVGYNPHKVDEIRTRIGQWQWDRIGISYHFLLTPEGHLNMVSSKPVNIAALDKFGVDRVITTYYRDLRDAVLTLPGDVLCHFDAVLRHHPDTDRFDPYEDLIEALLDAVSAKKMAVEVNTSGYRLRNEPFPAIALLQKAVARNIPLVAASDAHRPEDVGRYFDRLAKLELSAKPSHSDDHQQQYQD